MKNKISKELINETFEVSVNGFYHCVFHLLPQNEEVEIFIKNTEFFEDEIVELQKLQNCKYYEEGTQEYAFLVDIIKKYQVKRVR